MNLLLQTMISIKSEINNVEILSVFFQVIKIICPFVIHRYSSDYLPRRAH